MAGTVSLAETKRRARGLDGTRLVTAAQEKGFLVHLSEKGPTYTPEATGEPRHDTWERVAIVLDRFNETRSWRPAEYQDITHHASYVLAMLRTLYGDEALEQPQDFLSIPRASPTRLARSANRAHQRIGAVSNAHVGRDFERVAHEFFLAKGVQLTSNFPIELGLGLKKVHHFDLGASSPRILVECKSHRWTAGDKVPSAKMTVWNEAMYYFLLAPKDYRKYFFVLHDKRGTTGETLLEYYRRTYAHLIPSDVEFLEWDEKKCVLIG